jgi:hypothetical protein
MFCMYVSMSVHEPTRSDEGVMTFPILLLLTYSHPYVMIATNLSIIL